MGDGWGMCGCDVGGCDVCVYFCKNRNKTFVKNIIIIHLCTFNIEESAHDVLLLNS